MFVCVHPKPDAGRRADRAGTPVFLNTEKETVCKYGSFCYNSLKRENNAARRPASVVVPVDKRIMVLRYKSRIRTKRESERWG